MYLSIFPVTASCAIHLHEKDLLYRLRGSVMEQAASLGFEQRPELRPIRAAGHNPGEEFFLVPRNTQIAALAGMSGTAYQ